MISQISTKTHPLIFKYAFIISYLKIYCKTFTSPINYDVDAVINSSRALNKIDFECSYGGNPAFTFTGSLESAIHSREKWKRAVIMVVRELNELLRNTNTIVNFWEIGGEVIH